MIPAEIGRVDTIDAAALDGLVDLPRLDEWMAGHDLPGSGPITGAVKLTGGSQNNIFLLQRGRELMVLRRPPLHLRPNSDETMVREARILAALSGTDVPHPDLYSLCEDTTVIGTCFYLMEPIDGFSPGGPLPGRYATHARWRRRLVEEMVEGAARLGALDYLDAGLADFGRPENWTERQVGRWRSQLEGYQRDPAYGVTTLPHVDAVAEWLDANRPSTQHIGILHGDYHFANVLFARDRPRLSAIVDWELASLGDPLLDLGWMLAAFVEEGDPPGRGVPLQPWDGIPSSQALIDLYSQISGRSTQSMPWYCALACYKLAILLEGTYARSLGGLAPREIGELLHAHAAWLLEKAASSIARS